MEELQHNFSMMWSIDDLNTVLRLSDGDKQLAIGRILRHERTGLPAEALIRSLMSVDDNMAHHHQQQRLQQTEGVRMAPPHTSDMQDATRLGRQPPLHEEMMAAPLRPYGVAETRSRRPRTSHDHNRRVSIPSVIQWNVTEPRLPSEAVTPMLSVPPEVLLQRLSQTEKDALLRHLLSCPGQQDGRQTRKEGRSKIPNNDTNIPIKERDMLNIQAGIYMSLKDNGEEARKNRLKLDEDEAMEVGIRVSRHAFVQLCRRQDREEETERHLIERVTSESLRYSKSLEFVSEVEACLIEEAQRESLTSSAASSSVMSEEELRFIIEDVKRESLASPGMTNEQRLIEEVKRESLMDVQSKSAVSIDSVPIPSMDESVDGMSFISDRKPPARDLTRANEARLPPPLGGHFNCSDSESYEEFLVNLYV